MPIEVREIIVKVLVEGATRETTAITQASSNMEEDDKAELVAECVEQVLQILEDKEEP